MRLDEAVEHVVRGVRAATGTEGDVIAVEADSMEVGVRLGTLEKLKRSRERRLALRVFVGRSSAIVSSADLRAAALDSLVENAVDLARSTADDPFGGLADPPLERTEIDLDLFDRSAQEASVDDLLASAKLAEEAALGADPRLVNSEGAEASATWRQSFYASTRGFEGRHEGSSFSISAVPVAESEGIKQRDYWYSTARHRSDLEDPQSVGRIAAKRTLRRIGARPVKTQQAPVVFDAETASSLVGHLVGAVSGSAIYRGLSFLRDKLGSTIFPATVRIVDDPLRKRGLASRRFDGEGMPSRENVIVDDGTLATFLLDSYSARKLGSQSTASAVRSFGEPPSAGPSNVYLRAGSDSPEAIIGSVRGGLYVTELIGSSINPVTGDYSRGAAGVWIENGELTYPVEGITIAGNLLEMYAAIEAIGRDLVFRSTISAPTVKIGRMTIAGEG